MIQHIEYLLTRHDCVVVPGFGAFLNIYRQAWFDADRGVFNAPSVAVGFNPQINHNDWLLADSMARRSGIARESALAEINRRVADLLCRLDADGEITFGSLGILRHAEGETPLFESDGQLVTEFTGLAPVAVDIMDTDSAPDTADDGEAVTIPYTTPSRFGRFIRVAACLIAVIAAGIMLFNVTDRLPADEHTHYASMDSAFKAYDVIDALFADEEISAPELLIAARPASEPIVAKPRRKPMTASETFRLDATDRYMLVVGSFATLEQAEQFMSEHKSVRLGVVECDGYFRIYAATSATLSGATAAAQSDALKSRFSSAWILRNP